jgi:hypothetical protein
MGFPLCRIISLPHRGPGAGERKYQNGRNSRQKARMGFYTDVLLDNDIYPIVQQPGARGRGESKYKMVEIAARRRGWGFTWTYY